MSVLTEATLPSDDDLHWAGTFDLLSKILSGTTVTINGPSDDYVLQKTGSTKRERSGAISAVAIKTHDSRVFAKTTHIEPSVVQVGSVANIDGLPVRVMSIRFSG